MTNFPNFPIRTLAQSGGRNALTFMGVVAAACAVGIVIGQGDRLGGTSFGITLVLVVAFGVFVLVRSFALCRDSLRRGLGWTRLTSGLIGAIMLIAVALSGFQLVAGLRESTLAKLGLPIVNARGDVADAFLLFLLAGVALVAGEELAAATKPRKRRPPIGDGARFETRWTYFALIGLALVGFTLAGGETQQESFTSRATAGEGVRNILASAYTVAVAAGILQRHWGSRILAALSIGMVGYGLLLGGGRTPLAIVGAAVVMRLMVETRAAKHTLRLIVGGLALTYVSLVFLVGVSSWRGAVAERGSASLSATLLDVAPDPFSGLSGGGGLDTLDGLILARQVDRQAVGAHVTDPVKALTTFVPRSVWPSKPEFLGRPISAYYTNFGGNAGLFLSGAGYGYIVFLGAGGMALMFLVLGYLLETGYRSMRVGSIWTVLMTYFAVRFFFAGDAFDAHHVLGLCLLAGVAYVATRAVAAVLRVGMARS